MRFRRSVKARIVVALTMLLAASGGMCSSSPLRALASKVKDLELLLRSILERQRWRAFRTMAWLNASPSF